MAASNVSRSNAIITLSVGAVMLLKFRWQTTAAIEMKVFTAIMDIMLTATGYNPLEPISDHQKALDAIRCKNWSMRCVIVEDAAYQSRPARNSLQVVSVKERSSSFVGTPRPLFAMQAENFRPGLYPCM